MSILSCSIGRSEGCGITLHDNVVVRAEDSRKVLAGIGIGGEIVHTPGHPSLVIGESAAAVANSWRELQRRDATTVYPGHGLARTMPPAGDG